MAVTETDRFGNPVRSESIPLVLYGKSKNQAKALIGDACARIVQIAQDTKKPLVVEALDFEKKRAILKALKDSTARLLSSFAYRQILDNLCSRSYRFGIEFLEVNPAFTSLIGRIKYAKQYGLSVHQAAALCIARRFYGFSEKLPSQSLVPNDKGGHLAFSVPVRNRKKNECSYLKKVARRFRTALAEHFRVTTCQSTAPT